MRHNYRAGGGGGALLVLRAFGSRPAGPQHGRSLNI